MPFDVPEGWCWCRLDEVADYGKCQTTSIEDIDDDSWILELEDIEKDSGRVLKRCTKADREIKGVRHSFCKGNVLYSKLRTYLNKVLIANEAGFCTTEIMPIECGPCLHPTYLCHVLRSKYFLDYTVQCGYGVKMPRLSTADACKAMIPVAPIEEQKRIAVMIENLDLLIDLLDENKQILEAGILQAKSKILDLAIHGKLVSQDANDEPASVLLKRINPKAVASCDNPHYDEPYELPNGWQWMELGKLAVDSADGPFGSNLKKEHYTQNKEVRIIQLSNIGEEGWRDENTKYTTFEHLTEISRSEVKAGDVVIAKMMPAGRAILCPNYDVKYVLSSDAVKFVLPVGICNDYVLNAINSSVFREQVYDNVQGVTRVRTSLQKLRTYVLPIPPYNEQLRIVSKVRELFSQIDMIEKSLQA